MIKDEILKNLAEALEKINVKDVVLTLEKPANTDFGDYSSSLPLKLTKQLKKNPMTISEEIVKNFPKNDSIKKIEIVKPCFINFWIADVQLINRLTEVVEKNFIYPEYYFGKNKKLKILMSKDPCFRFIRQYLRCHSHQEINMRCLCNPS